MQNTGGLQTEYKNYGRQKCFVGHSLGAEWCEDLQSACAEILPKFNLEPWYAADQFTPTQTLRDKVVELIANSRFGIYDISSWKDRDGNWQLPRNVYIELGIAIALNRPTLLLRHTSNQELQSPTCLQGIKPLEFTGDVTLKKALEVQLPQWIDVPPDRDWLNRFCIFGNQTCSFREKHPCAQQWGQEKIYCHVYDGFDKNHPCYHQSECDEIRGAFEDILNRYSDLNFNYLDEVLIADSYQYLLCSHCQTVRSTPFAIYRISPNTSAETFIAIGISIALEKLFEYKIPKVILVKNERDLPSLLRGYEVVEAVNSKEIKQKLKAFLPTVMKTVRETTWRPRPLPFSETIILYNNLSDKAESELLKNSEEDPLNQITIEELQISSRVYQRLKRVEINTIADLLNYYQEDLLEISGFGHKSLQDLVQAVYKRCGIILPSEKDILDSASNKSLDIEYSIKPIDIEDSIAQKPIEELQLSVQVYNYLKRAQINSVADLLNYTQQDLLKIQNFRQKEIEEVIEALHLRYGISLPQNMPYIPGSSIRGKLREIINNTQKNLTESIEKIDDSTTHIPIEELQLSIRAYNCLKMQQIHFIKDLLAYTQKDLLKIKNFGQKSAEEVVEALQRRLGITLPSDEQERQQIFVEQINSETQRLGWTTETARDALIQLVGKRSRWLCSNEELRKFIIYLQSQPTPKITDALQ